MRHPDRSLVVDVDGPVRVADLGGPSDAPVVLCVHGLAGSAESWRPLASASDGSHRVLAIDLPGHGRSPSAGRSLAVPDSARLVASVVDQLGVGPVVLAGHSMGAAVSALAAEMAPDLVERLLLLAPPVPRVGLPEVSMSLLPHVALCLWPKVGLAALRRQASRRTLEEHVREGLRLTCASLEDLDDLVVALAADLQAAYDEGEDPLATFVRAARSVGLLVAGGRRYREALEGLRTPATVVQGALDRVLKPSGLDDLVRLQPTWRTHLLDDVGHSPHLEAPVRVASLMRAPAPVTAAPTHGGVVAETAGQV
ncbi:alpha/beta fold hydrolase [Nocardioides xinjiangensis]|uniref:alpha/beta fold hydrolase n=1 Tax=Nocardioides xinjiangensis TaxID=2817376 RepID=UPI001B3060A8|nr:alpha/beta fold hydrolase [Nocardioides sp. SYSU D00778]